MDFDGVFTDNKVSIDQNGDESVLCHRGDGLGFDMLRAFKKANNWNLNYFILSKEKNPVVSIRAQKLGIKCIQALSKKADYLRDYLNKNNLSAEGLLYLGNDLNDLSSMQLSGVSVAPSDAHAFILKHATIVLPCNGGNGFVRTVIELLIEVEKMSSTQIEELLNY